MDKYILNGHSFDTLEEYEQAKREKKGIAFVCSQMDLSDIKKVKSVYEQISKQNLFRTVIGFEFMDKLRKIIGEDSVEDYTEQIAATSELPVDIITDEKDNSAVMKKERSTKKKKDIEKPDKKYLVMKEKLFTSVVLNIILAIIIAIMMYIASTSNSITIVNYETRLQDKYSSWAEELKEKESELRELEKEIDNNSNSQN